MRIFQLPIEQVNALRTWFHPKDRSIILDGNTFIEGEELATPSNPTLNRGRLYWKNNFWTQLNSSGVENILTGPALIAETILTGNATTVTFSGIPQIFRHLMIVCQARTDAAVEADGILFRANGDTGSNYDWQRLNIIGAAVTATVSRGATSIQVGLGEAANSRASNFSPSLAYIFGYTRTDNEKWVLSQNTAFGDVSADTDLVTQQRAGRWRNTTAINSITLLPLTGANFVSGSRFQLYGVN